MDFRQSLAGSGRQGTGDEERKTIAADFIARRFQRPLTRLGAEDSSP